jgi:hypothetical protein
MDRDRAKRIARSVGPWLVGAAITLFVALRLPIHAFRSSLHEGPHLLLLAVNFAIMIGLLIADTVASWIGLIAVRLRMSFKQVFAIRGATYLLALLNYVAGQGGLGYYLKQAGVPTARAVSATLFLIGTTLATLLLVTTAAWSESPSASSYPGMWWTLVGGCIAFVIYLVIIAARPAVLARRAVFGALFDAHIRGHAIAIVARLPHVILIVLGHWFAMRAWGLPVPFWTAAITLPAVVIASAIPISPAGFGTTQAALVYFFAQYAPGATPAEQEAALLAFAIAHFVYGVIAQIVIGFACIPLAKRLTASAPAP